MAEKKEKTVLKDLGKTEERVIANVRDVNVIQTAVGAAIGFVVWFVMSKIVNDDPIPPPDPQPDPSPIIPKKDCKDIKYEQEQDINLSTTSFW